MVAYMRRSRTSGIEEEEVDSGLSVPPLADLQDVDTESGPSPDIAPPPLTHPLLKDTSPFQQYTC